MKYDISDIQFLQRLIIYTRDESANCGDVEVIKLLSLVSVVIEKLVQEQSQQQPSEMTNTTLQNKEE